MIKHTYFLLLIGLFILLNSSKSLACGYDWVGDCSSSVHLRINGTLDSFIIAECPSGFRFQGQYLGNLQSLSLANARAITWESCLNNVTAVGLKYRVYEQGGSGGSFQILPLDQDYFTVLGPYTTRYRSKASSIDLTTGLTLGKTYVLEVYLVADVDTIGDDFIPETTIVKNNGGQNYQLTFTYGGPSAPPFVVIPTTVLQPKCHGESNGTIGVSVWGDHTGLFYNWSNVALNFYEQFGLAAGTYTVSVSGANYSEAVTVALGQPDALSLQATAIQPVACGGGQGLITVQASGGVSPYHYAWQNGQSTQTATFPTSGSYKVSLTDAHNCPFQQAFALPATGLVNRSLSATICTGSSVQISGQIFNAAGEYQFTIPGNAGCDTLVHLSLSESNPATLLASLPANILISCNEPSKNLCAESSAAATYQWSKDGIPATQTPCLLATAGGVYQLTVTQDGCTATRSIVSEEHLVPPIFSAGGLMGFIMDCYTVDTTLITFTANLNSPGAQYEWTLNGQLLTTNDTCILYFEGYPSSFLVPTIKATNQYGCSASKQPLVQAGFPPMAPFPEIIDYRPDLCTGLTKVEYQVWGGNSMFTITWDGIPNTGDEIFLAPGQHLINITDQQGCQTQFYESVPPAFSAYVHDSDIPNWNTGSIQINTFSGSYSFEWSNGEQGWYLDNLAGGVYCLTLTDLQSLCSLDTCFTVLGWADTQAPEHSGMNISPNPAAPCQILVLRLPQVLAGAPLQLECWNSEGVLCFSQTVEPVSGQLEFKIPENIPSGMFLLRVSGSRGQASGKLCLKK